MYKEKIVNLETGQEIWRDYTSTEIEEVEKAQLEAAEEAEKEAEIVAKRFATITKLEALGLDADDIKALGLG